MTATPLQPTTIKIDQLTKDGIGLNCLSSKPVSTCSFPQRKVFNAHD